MTNIKDFFIINVSIDKMTVEINCTKAYQAQEVKCDVLEFQSFLEVNKITHGINKESINHILSGIPSTEFPVVIANGTDEINGINGDIEYFLDYSSDIVRGDNWDFRQVMNIPNVPKDCKLAKIHPPSNGYDGVNVYGDIVLAKRGKPYQIRAGKGVRFNDSDLTFYSSVEGQISVTERMIQVHSVFEVNESLSMKTGNLDFVGTIIIHGNVPAGYTVKAEGDIKIFGLVESAQVVAGGSIFISEGLAGLKTGRIEAKENIHIGYINQGIAYAGDTIFVENSVIHSECIARNKLYCQQGNIIGGSLSVGKSIEAKDIGNRLSTETIINLGLDNSVSDQQKKLILEKENLTKTLMQLKLIGEKIKNTQDIYDSKIRLTLLKQRNSKQKISERLNVVDTELEKTSAYLGDEKDAELIIRNKIYSNVIISFGKYKQKTNSNRQFVKVKLEQNEIIMHSLE